MTTELARHEERYNEFARLLGIIEHVLGKLIEGPSADEAVTEQVAHMQGTLVSLQRSCALSGKAARKYDDRANTQKRAALLQDQLSSTLNRRLGIGENRGDFVGEVLDRAKDFAMNIALTDPPNDLYNEVDNISQRESEGRSREVFLINFCYELLVRADEWLHFSEMARGPNIIERSIEFPPEYFNAGMMVLNEFATIIRERHGKSGARVQIHQHDLRVRLVIETADSKEEIERTLDEYRQVLSGDRDVDSFINSAIERVRLEGALELAQARLNAELRITNVLEAEVRVRGEQLDHVTRLLASALASNQEFADHHHDFALTALNALTSDRYGRVLVEIARLAAGYVGDRSREELEEIRAIAGRESETDICVADSKLRSLLKRLMARDPALIDSLCSAVAAGIISQEAATWIDALLKNLF